MKLRAPAANAAYMCTLPSRGKYYGGKLAERIRVTPMRGVHEERLASAKNSNASAEAAVFDLVQSLAELGNFPVDELLVCDFSAIMYAVMTVTYGSTLEVVANCPHCGQSNRIEMDIGEIPVQIAGDDTPPEPFQCNLHNGDEEPFDVRFRFMRMSDMRKYNDYKRSTMSKFGKQIHLTGDDEASYLLASTIVSVDGQDTTGALDARPLREWVASLTTAQRTDLAEAVKAVSFGYDAEVKRNCVACGGEIALEVRPEATLFRRKSSSAR
jgi:hypothetical protein